jgi:hypothetical protein
VQQFGEVTKKEVNLAVPELVLQYRLRAHAELAAASGKHHNDRTLSVSIVIQLVSEHISEHASEHARVKASLH